MRTVFLVGCGAVGRSLGRALADSGRYAIAGVNDAVAGRAAAAAAELVAEASSGALPSGAARAEIVLVAVPGGAIAGIAERAAREGGCGEGQIWLHTDGSATASALGALRGRVRGIGALHPARAFPRDRVTGLAACAFAVSGEPAAAAVAEEIARDLGGFVVRIDDGARDAYHAAAVLASNCAIALLAGARDVLERSCGLAAEDAERLATGLAAGAVGAARDIGIEASLTGPIRRGEAATVRRHLEALAAFPGALDAYRALGRAALALARRQPGYPAGAAEEIARALADVTGAG